MAFAQVQVTNDSLDFLASCRTEKQLRRFVSANLLPSQHFINERLRDIRVLAKIIKQNCQGVSNVEVFGSFAKGTDIDGLSDLDVVVFYSDFTDMGDYIDQLPAMLDELYELIIDWRTRHDCYAWIEHKSHHALTVTFRANQHDDVVKIDILPAYDILHHETLQQVYHEMDDEDCKTREFYGTSLDSLQLHFVRERIKHCEDLKKLIILVKYWKKTYLHSLGDHQHLPPSYMFELLCIHLWENAGSPQQFSLCFAFKSVMQQLIHYRSLDVNWTEYYDKNWYRNSARKCHRMPYILDPANPFENACRKCDTWPEIVQLARTSYNCPLLRHVPLDWY